MHEATETITVVNRKYNNATGLDDWIPTIITGASWYSKLIASVTQTGLKAADTAAVRIPVDADTQGRTYMPPAAYKAAESVSDAFTLAHGDLIVRGEVAAGLTPAEITAAHDDCFTIVSVSDNTRRPHGAHWKVVGA